MNNLYEEIEREREKLNRLASQALKNKQPFWTSDVLLAQSRRLDLLMGKLATQRKVTTQRSHPEYSN